MIKSERNFYMISVRELGCFPRNRTFNDLPVNVREKVNDLTIDQLGIQQACATLPWGKILIHYDEVRDTYICPERRS